MKVNDKVRREMQITLIKQFYHVLVPKYSKHLNRHNILVFTLSYLKCLNANLKHDCFNINIFFDLASMDQIFIGR